MLTDLSTTTRPPEVADPPADRAMLALQYVVAIAAALAALALASQR